MNELAMNVDVSSASSAWIALIGTLFGGAGLEITRRFLGRRTKQDIASSLRAELRADLVAKNAEMEALKDEIIEWKGKYYDLLDEYLNYKYGIDKRMQEHDKLTRLLKEGVDKNANQNSSTTDNAEKPDGGAGEPVS